MPKTTAKSQPKNEQPQVVAPNTTITITIPWKEVEPAYTAATKKLSKKVKASGFRPGKVPAKIAIDAIGQEKLRDEVLNQILPEHYQAAITAENKQPITYPEFEPTATAAGQDWVITAQLAEKPVVQAKNYQKVVKKTKQQLKNEPHEHHHHGEEKETTAPAKTPEQLQAEENEHTLSHIYRDLVLEYHPAIPELLIKNEARYDLEQLARSLQPLQMDLDTYLGKRQITFEQLSNELATQALGRLQLEFILQDIIKQAEITANDEDFEAYFNRIQDEKLREQQRQNQEYRNYVGSLIIRQKISDHLLAL